MDTVYKIVVDLSTQGSLNAQLGETQGKLGDLDKGFGKLLDGVRSVGSGMADAFTGAVEKAGSVAMSLAKIGAVAAGGAAVYAVTSLNNELENTQISLAAIFSANGLSTFTGGMKLASDQVERMRKDVAALPGTLSELSDIFKTISVPALQAGASIDKIRDMSAKTMVVGKVLGVDPATAAREMGMLLGGRAGGHNILGMRLAGLSGATASAFNQKGAAERLDYLSKSIERFAPAIEAYAHSYAGLASTFRDNAKHFVSVATMPLFEHVKGTLDSVNKWFDGNQDKVTHWALRVGDSLAGAWDTGIDKIREWGPVLIDFAGQAYDKIQGVWTAIAPVVKSVMGSLESALADGSGVAKIESILKLYAAVKIGGPLLGGGMSLAGSLAKIGGAEGGAFGAAGVAGIAAFSGAALAATAATVGFTSALTDVNSKYHGEAVVTATELSKAFGKLSDTVSVTLMPALEQFGVWAAKAATWTLNDLAKGIGDDSIGGSKHPWYQDLFDYLAPGGYTSDDLPSRGVGVMHDQTRWGLSPGKALIQPAVDAAVEAVARKGAGGGGGGTKIAKVEIMINSNQDPSRIARVVAGVLGNMKRHPKSARGVHNFSVIRP